jgi:hypothetical protein
LLQATNFDLIQASIKQIDNLLSRITGTVSYDAYPDEVHYLVMNAFTDGVQVLMMILDTLATREVELLDQQEYLRNFNVAGSESDPTEVVPDLVELNDDSMKEVINMVASFTGILGSIIEEERVAPTIQEVEVEESDEEDAAALYLQREDAVKNKAIFLYSAIETATVEADTISGYVAELLGGEAAEEYEIEYEYYDDEEDEFTEDISDAQSRLESQEAAAATHVEHSAGEMVDTATLLKPQYEAGDDVSAAESSDGNNDVNTSPKDPKKLSKAVSSSPSMAFVYVPPPTPGGITEKFSSVVLNKVAEVSDIQQGSGDGICGKGDKVGERSQVPQFAKVKDSLNHVVDGRLSEVAEPAEEGATAGASSHKQTRRTSIAYRPDGWNTQRLKRVQEMELNDRRQGVPEAIIVQLRVARQQEVGSFIIGATPMIFDMYIYFTAQVETSMIQELKFSEKKKMFENRAGKPLFPTGYAAKK